MAYSFRKSFLKKSTAKKGATIIIGLGLSALLIIFAVGVGMVIRNTTINIRAFQDQWKAQLVAESVKEKLLLLAKNREAGFSIGNTDADNGDAADSGCEGKVTEVIDVMTTALNSPSAGSDMPPADGAAPAAPILINSTGKCLISGKNDEPVGLAGNIVYTVPKANTGDAGVDCSPLRKFTTVANLTSYYGNAAVPQLFGSDPLNHPCNWGKLKFGNNINSRVVVPLYYDQINVNPGAVADAVNIQNPSDIGLTELRIRLRTPCKPPIERTIGANPCVDMAGNINTSDYWCKYPDICKASDRYQIGGTDKVIVSWQISGECTMQNASGGSLGTESCEMGPNDTKNAITLEPEGENSEIYTNLINVMPSSDNYADTFQRIQSDKGKIAYYGEKNCAVPGIDMMCVNDTIGNFLLLAVGNPIVLNTEDERYTSIEKPILQLSIIVNGLTSTPLEKNIPYLEYQIVTDKPVSNISQQFTTEINYGDQAFKQSYSIDQKKNVVDFALQD